MRIAQGWVRCGQCQAVYKAYDNLTLDKEQEEAQQESAPVQQAAPTKLQRINALIAAKKAQAQQSQTTKNTADAIVEKTTDEALFLEEPDLWELCPDTEVYYEVSDSTAKKNDVVKNSSPKHIAEAPQKIAVSNNQPAESQTQAEPSTVDTPEPAKAPEKPVATEEKTKTKPAADTEPKPAVQAQADTDSTLKDTPELRKKLKRLERRRKKILEYRKKKAARTEQEDKLKSQASKEAAENNAEAATPKAQATAPTEKPVASAADTAQETVVENTEAETTDKTPATPTNAATDSAADTDTAPAANEANSDDDAVKTYPIIEADTNEAAPESPASTPEPAPATPASAASPPTAEENLSFVRKAQQRAFWAKPKVRITLMICIMIACFGLITQIVYYWRSEIYARVPISRDVFDIACGMTGCQIPPWQNIKAITIENSYFRKQDDSSYRLGISVRNTSRHRVAMPALELILLDHNEQILVRRIITQLPAPTSLPPRGEWNGAVALDVRQTPELQQRGLAGYRVAVLYVSNP